MDSDGFQNFFLINMLEKMTFNHSVLTFPKIRKHLQSKLTDGSFLMHTQGLTNEGHAKYVP